MSHKNSRRKAAVKGPHIYCRDGVYYANLGQRRRVSLGTTSLAEARAKFAAELATAGPDVRRKARVAEVPLIEITEQYLDAPHGWTRTTLQTATSRVEMVGHWFEKRGVTLASEITPALMDQYVNEQREHVTHRTINRNLRCWRLCLKWATDRALCNPCDAVVGRGALREAKRTTRRVIPDPREIARVIDHLAAHDKSNGVRNRAAAACVSALYATGLRAAELQRLVVGDLHDGVLWVRPEQGAAATSEPGKSHRERAIPLAPQAQDIVKHYLRVSAGHRVFSQSWLIKAVAAACELALVPAFGLHDLRRAFATEAHRAGVAVLIISRWLGHADVRTTELYLGEYRTDRAVIAPVPRGLADCAPLSTTGAIPTPFQPISTDEPTDQETKNNVQKKPKTKSHPSGLNRRPMVYETAVSQSAASKNTGDANSTEHRVSTKRAKGGAR